MKNIFNLNSLNKKLLVVFLTVTIIPLIITVIVLYYSTERGFIKLIDNQQEEMIHTIQTQFNTVAEELLDITRLYATDEELIEAFQTTDRNELLEIVDEIYPRLQAEHRFDVFEFGETAGTVFLRGHNPEKFGDDKSEISAIQSALEGQSISGFEFGSSGLAVRAFAPIMVNNEVIGTLQTGVDAAFLQELNQMLQGVAIDLYDQEGTVVISSNEDNMGETTDNIAISDVIAHGEIITQKNHENLNSYLPMYDPTGSEIIGVIGISQDISVINDTRRQITLISLIITILTVLIVLGVSIKFSKSIANPVKRIAQVMDELSKGNLKVEIDQQIRNDEIGQLTEATQLMRDKLYETIEQVADASLSVFTQSEELTHAALEVRAGSEQIAMTMQEIAIGAEQQADGASNLAQTMGDFTEKVKESSEKSNQIHAASNEVLEMSNEGISLMASSDRQMSKIDEIVQAAVKKMEKLDHQTQEISQLVLVIQEISNQTNLLALNAAIEAARAGEHGQGFAVVADEVRKLSEQVSVSVKDITNIVTSIQIESTDVTTALQSGYQEVEQGARYIQTTNETFTGIDRAVTEMVGNVELITQNLTNFAANSLEMNHAVEEIATISEESAAGIEETAATSQQSSSSMEEVSSGSEKLAHLAEELNSLVRYFRF
jgi:methyl-accepting chemotaxis protein